jgi:hypothetical protein
MTQTLRAEPSANGSLVDEWDGLPPAEDVILPDPVDLKPDVLSDGPIIPGTCAACGDPIVREPGSRGRLPKYHPDCRPARNSPRTGTRRSATRAEAETDEVLVLLHGWFTKAALMLSMADPYDGFVVMVQLPAIEANLRGVLLRYDGFRRDLLAMRSGGSIVGLVLSLLMVALPIAAHHKLIRAKILADILQKAPFTMWKLNQRLAEGTESLTRLMEQQVEAQQEAAREAQARAQRAHGGN